MESEMISTENIKPSSPTPPHLKYHKLSLLDQIFPHYYFHWVFYFLAPENPEIFSNNISEKTQLLKNSLSVALTRFYPLAGRINVDDPPSVVDCNDEGLLLTVTKFKGNLSDFLKRKPDPTAAARFLPGERSSISSSPTPDGHVVMIQINHFECGGMTIGFGFLHSVVDGLTASTFMKAWSDIARGGGEIVGPSYVAESFFPQTDPSQKELCTFSLMMSRYLKTGKTVMRRYVFDASAIATLKARMVGSSPELSSPTRVEIVAAFIWKCFMTASVANNKAISVVGYPVELRPRANPAFPKHCFGNFLWFVPISCTNQPDIDLNYLTRKIRDAFSKIDDDFIKQMQGDESFSGYCKNVKETVGEFPENADFLLMACWCGYGVYEVDFGWGKPVWLNGCDAGSDSEISFLNQVRLNDTPEGDGIEAWTTLDEKYMEIFDSIPELHALASIDPSPLEFAVTTP